MPLLDIVASKRLTAIVMLEETTAKQIDQYAAFAKAPADDVLNKALEYVFSKDKDFQKHLETSPAAKPPVGLRIRRNSNHNPKPNGNGAAK